MDNKALKDMEISMLVMTFTELDRLWTELRQARKDHDLMKATQISEVITVLVSAVPWADLASAMKAEKDGAA
jgi:hypothetical protein